MFPVPDAMLDDCFAVLGKRGAGKSNIRQVIFEYELSRGRRSVLIDIKGDSWGIRLNPDGNPSEFQIPILGGRHGDYPISEDMGADIGQLISTHDMSCIIDLSDLYQEQQRRFMLGFAQTLLHVNRAPLTLLVEEADVLAPQISGAGGPTSLINAMSQLVKLGRQRGIVMGMFTQRPQSFNKNLISQVDTLLGLRVTSPRDRDAFKDWFSAYSKDAGAQAYDQAAKLDRGESFTWIAEVDYFERVKWPLCQTYDSGRTPKHGETIDDVQLLPVDLEAIRAALGNDAPPPVPISKTDDSAEITRLKARLAEMSASELNSKAVIAQKDRRLSKVLAIINTVMNGLDDARRDILAIEEPIAEFTEAVSAPAPAPVMKASRAEVAPHTPARLADNSKLGASTLDVLYHLYDLDRGNGLTEKAWAMLAGINRKSSTWRAHKAKLRPYFDEDSGRYRANSDGADIIKKSGKSWTAPNLPGNSLVALWGSRVSKGSERCLVELMHVYPAGLNREKLAAKLLADPAPSTFRAWLAPLNTLELIEKRGGEYFLSAELMERQG